MVSKLLWLTKHVTYPGTFYNYLQESKDIFYGELYSDTLKGTVDRIEELITQK